MLCLRFSHVVRTQHVMHPWCVLAVAMQPQRVELVPGMSQHAHRRYHRLAVKPACMISHLVVPPVCIFARIGFQTLLVHHSCKHLAMRQHIDGPTTTKPAITGLSIDRDMAVALHSSE